MTQYAIAALILGFVAYVIAYYVGQKRIISGWLFSSVLGVFCILFVFPGHFWVPGVEALHDWGLPIVKGVFAACWAVGVAVASSIFQNKTQDVTEQDSLS